MGADPVLHSVMDGAHLQIDGLQTTEGLLDFGKILVGPHHVAGIEVFLAQRGNSPFRGYISERHFRGNRFLLRKLTLENRLEILGTSG